VEEESMGYPKQPKSKAQLDAVTRRLYFLTLCEQLEDENTRWEREDPVQLRAWAELPEGPG
jgi:hypothetical protein